MAVDLSEYLVIGVSSRALFDLSVEEKLFQSEGLAAYSRHQVEREHEVLEPGPGFPLIRAILNLNSRTPGKRRTEVIIMSRNSSETSLRIFNSIDHYKLDITRAVLTGGAALTPYLHAFNVSLFLSMDESSVRAALEAGVASAILYDKPANPSEELDQIRIAFDGDAVIFSDEAERIYKQQGLEAFVTHEIANAKRPLPEGPFARLLKALAYIQTEFPGEDKPIRTALVTARDRPSHERIIRTLRAWQVHIDETFFMGGVSKEKILAAFRPHMFFDDQKVHCEPASRLVPTGRVPSDYK